MFGVDLSKARLSGLSLGFYFGALQIQVDFADHFFEGVFLLRLVCFGGPVFFLQNLCLSAVPELILVPLRLPVLPNRVAQSLGPRTLQGLQLSLQLLVLLEELLVVLIRGLVLLVRAILLVFGLLFADAIGLD